MSRIILPPTPSFDTFQRGTAASAISESIVLTRESHYFSASHPLPHLSRRNHARLSSAFSPQRPTFPRRCTAVFFPLFHSLSLSLSLSALTIFSRLRSIIYKRIHRCFRCSFPALPSRSRNHQRCSFISIVPR